jgi:uncharacterized protein YjbI with pentapeptide repeats
MKSLHSNDEFSELDIVKSDYSEQNLSKVRISSSKFKNTVLANTDFSYSTFYQVKFTSCNLTGTQFIKNSLSEVEFSDCKFKLGSFMFSELKNVTFEKCVFDDLDFRDMKLENVTFDDCVIDKIDFNGSRATKKMDISSSKLISVQGVLKLKGLVISEDQLLSLAPFMASELGFTVRES